MTKLLTAAIAIIALSATAGWGITATWDGGIIATWDKGNTPLYRDPGVRGVAAGTVTATPAGTVATETPTVEPTATPIPDTPTPLTTFFVVNQGGCAVALPSSGVAPWWFALVPIAFLWLRPPAVRGCATPRRGKLPTPRRGKLPTKRRERRGGG